MVERLVNTPYTWVFLFIPPSMGCKHNKPRYRRIASSLEKFREIDKRVLIYFHNGTLGSTTRPHTMGKKRKASGQPYGHRESQEDEKTSAKLTVTTYEDVANSEDEFHINRDKILLDEGPEQKRRRKVQEQGEQYNLTYSAAY